MILASRPKSSEKQPSQPRRAPAGDPGGGEIPMRLNAQPEDMFVDCIVVPDIRTITSNPRNAFEVVEKLQNEGVDLFTMIDDRFSKATSTISVLRAYRQCNKTCKCEQEAAVNKSVNTASFYYSLNMLKLLQEMHLISEDEADKIKKSLSNHYKVTDIYYR